MSERTLKQRMHRFGHIVSFLATLTCIAIFVACVTIIGFVIHFSRDLPDYKQLAAYNPPTTTRLYASNGQMIEEYAKEKRLYVPITAIPKRVTHAFIAAEDKNFYHHPGIDVVSIFKAAYKNIINYGQNKRLVGASTITQQVVKNFLLTNERSLTRKIKEAILAFRVTQAFSKDRIMELYLNEIYLGNRSYGVAAAALHYFNKSLTELTVEEAAMLAALPKAPSNLDPKRHPERAKERRNWVISRMAEEGFIDSIEASLAIASDIEIQERETIELVNTGFFADAVRKELIDRYDEDTVYESGLSVRTTINPMFQKHAEHALMKGLLAYDKRHGWRGALGTIDLNVDWQTELENFQAPPEIGSWRLAVVKEMDAQSTLVGFANGQEGNIPLSSMTWAKRYIDENTMGSTIKSPNQVFNIGDVIAVSLTEQTDIYHLQQIPEVNGSIVAMNPYTGRVYAMVGGFYYGGSQFNRAIQAKRQPGSAFKPFVYLAALENGFAPNSIIVDEEIQLDRGEDMTQWRPQNHSGKYYGPTSLRVGVEKSRNAMTVRLAQLTGVGKIVDIAKRFSITENPERTFALVLGATETTLLKLVNGYASLVNGGKKISPSLIDYIQDSQGNVVYRRDDLECGHCQVDRSDVSDLQPPFVYDQREAIADPIAAYQIVSILEGAVQRGTGRKAKKLGRTLAGKTGTTNDSFDAWFVGFNSDLAVGVYVGFDTPRSLGKHEYGSSAALPIWVDFMKHALADMPDKPFRRPDGVKLVKIDAETGYLPSPTTPAHKIIYEAFRAGTEPTSSSAAKPIEADDNGLPDFSNGVY